MRKAPTNATIPMLTGRMVASTNIATSARIESNSGDTTHLLGASPVHGTAGCPIRELTDSSHLQGAQRVPSQPTPSDGLRRRRRWRSTEAPPMGRTRLGSQQKVAEWRPCQPVGPHVDLERPTVGEP